MQYWPQGHAGHVGISQVGLNQNYKKNILRQARSALNMIELRERIFEQERMFLLRLPTA